MKTSFDLKKWAPFSVLVIVALLSLFVPDTSLFDGKGVYNSADIAWILVATALVFLMTPGLAFFYGGMVNRKKYFIYHDQKCGGCRRGRSALDRGRF